MDLDCLDHVHFAVPDLPQAKRIYGPFLNGSVPGARFVDDYGGPEVNAWGAWHTSGGDFIQVIDRSKPAFGGATIPDFGITSVSFRVADVDRGIAQAKALGLTVRSRIGSEDIGLGKNVVQAQLLPEPVSALCFELIEHQLPGEYVSLTDAAVDYVEHALPPGVRLDDASRALERIFGSAFEPERVDRERGLRTRLHPALGLRLATAVAGALGGAAATAPNPGLRAIAFRCPDLEAGRAAAEGAGLEAAGATLREGRETDFLPWANVSLRLVRTHGG
jgi:catechol 2,3-dioxygenase-like lactoylglutathione lyase family enzyme